MTVNDLLRERLLAKLNLPEYAVGSLSDLLYAYLLDPDSGGGGGGVPEGVSSDENNALSNGTDGKAWLSESSFEDFVTNTGLATLLKYATLAFVLEANEDETDLPSDFPTGPLYPGGPAPLVFRKKAE